MSGSAQESSRGALASAACYFLWGLVPLYWKKLGAVDPLELIDQYGADATRYGLLKMCSTQDVRFAEQKYPGMRCRAIAAQFIDNGVVALFELTLQDGDVKVVDERHYKLVPHSDLDASAIRNYR